MYRINLFLYIKKKKKENICRYIDYVQNELNLKQKGDGSFKNNLQKNK